jgi:hypothetical protein
MVHASSGGYAPTRVFVSHNRKDKPWVRRLVTQLRELGLNVFFDEDSIPGGAAIAKGLDDAIESCDYTIVVLSPASVESSWVAREIAIATQLDPDARDRRLIPVMIEPVDQALLKPFRLLNIIDLTNPHTREAQYHHLLRSLGVTNDSLPSLRLLEERDATDFAPRPARRGRPRAATASSAVASPRPAAGGLGFDIGTSHTRIWVSGADDIVFEPTLVVVDESTGALRAAGLEARRMQGVLPRGLEVRRPMRKGAVADVDLAAMMLREFLRPVDAGHTVRRESPVVFSVPARITEAERHLVRLVMSSMGSRDSYTVAKPLAAALGMGILADSPAIMVDLGGGTTEISVIAFSGIVSESASTWAATSSTTTSLPSSSGVTI